MNGRLEWNAKEGPDSLIMPSDVPSSSATGSHAAEKSLAKSLIQMIRSLWNIQKFSRTSPELIFEPT